jgi:hypothetical protein
MKRHFNFVIWIGFLMVIRALVSYIPIFVFASTRDVPWANYDANPHAN